MLVHKSARGIKIIRCQAPVLQPCFLFGLKTLGERKSDYHFAYSPKRSTNRFLSIVYLYLHLTYGDGLRLSSEKMHWEEFF